MKPMVDISSSAGQEVSSAASPGNSGQAQSAPLQTADGISKMGTGSHRSHSCFPADGQVWWHGKKSLVTSWAPTARVLWDTQRRAGVAIPRGQGLLGLFPQDT